MKRFLTQPFFFQILALAFGFFLWLVVRLDRPYRFRLDIPLIVDELPENHVIVSSLPEKIKLEIQGKGKDLFILQLFNRISYRIDLKNFKVNQTYHIDTDLDHIDGLETENLQDISILEPNQLDILIGILAQKVVGVKAQLMIDSSLVNTYVQNFKVTPDQIKITGPEMILLKTWAIKTETVRIDQKNGNFETEVSLVKPDELSVILLEPAKVLLQVQLEEEKKKLYTDIPIMLQVGRNATAKKGETLIPEVSSCSVWVDGPEYIQDRLQMEHIRAVLLINQPFQQESRFSLQVKLTPANDSLKIIDWAPRMINVRKVYP